MVRVYWGLESFEDYDIHIIKTLRPCDVAEKIVGSDFKPDSYAVTYMGNHLDAEEPLAKLEDLDDDDCLRVIQLEKPSISTCTQLDQAVMDDTLKKLQYIRRINAATTRMGRAICQGGLMKMALKKVPNLREDSEVCQVLPDLYLLYQIFSDYSEARRQNKEDKVTKWLREHPLFVKAVHEFINHYYALTKNPKTLQSMQGEGMSDDEAESEENDNEAGRLMEELQRAAQAAVGGSGSGAAPAPQNPPPISADAFREAMMSAFGMAPPVQAQAPVPQPAQNSLEVLRQRYSGQLGQLREFGFVDEAQNLAALESASGDVETALNLIIAMREDS